MPAPKVKVAAPVQQDAEGTWQCRGIVHAHPCILMDLIRDLIGIAHVPQLGKQAGRDTVVSWARLSHYASHDVNTGARHDSVMPD